MRIHIPVLSLILMSLLSISANALTVSDLTCELRKRPLDVESPNPRLTWTLRSNMRGDQQTAYQILAASSQDRLDRGEGDLWDSGKVQSANSLHLPYNGKSLKSGQRCFWKVRAWDQRGSASSWSRSEFWEMGFLSPSDWKSKWINDGKLNPAKDAEFYQDDPAPLFRKEFQVNKRVARSRLLISGIGYYEASINGEKIGDQTLAPGWTRYDKKVFYTAYDTTKQLHRGANCIGVTLGNGWYNPLPLRMWGHLNLREHLPVGRPRFIAQLEIEYEDGTRQSILSDTNWKVTNGPIQFNSIYLGEVYDARKEIAGWNLPGFDASRWAHPKPASEAIGPLQAQSQPHIRVTRTFAPIGVSQPKPGVFIFDMGQNFGGWIRLKLNAQKDTVITMRYGELLNKDGSLNPMTSVAGQIKGARGNGESAGGPGAPKIAVQRDVYIANGQKNETYTPHFTFHAFRYVEVTGVPGDPSRVTVVGLGLNSDVERTGNFHCSNAELNHIQKMCDATFLSNIFSVQSDCPHRERFGYGGDLAVTSEAFMMNYNMSTFYAKVVGDWKDNALPNGMFTDTAPFVGIQYCGVAWAMAHPLLQYQLYQYYGDRRLIEEQYAASKKWLDLVAQQNPSLIIQDGLSDHEALVSAPAPEMVTPLFAQSARLVSKLAAILGYESDSRKYNALSEEIIRKYNARFLDTATGKVGQGTQANQSFALALDIVPAAQRSIVLDRLINDVQGSSAGHLSTGIFGTKFMLDTLSQTGNSKIAYNIVNQKSFPGWRWMLENGATTLWEHWEGSENTYSHNHPMFGSVSGWFYHWLGGIRPAPDAIGFDKIIIQPQTVPDISEVQCSYRSIRGEIISNWKRNADGIEFEIELPVGISARVVLPASAPDRITESGMPLAKSRGVKQIGTEKGNLSCQIVSGHYRFRMRRN